MGIPDGVNSSLKSLITEGLRVGIWIGIVCVLASLARAGGDPHFSGTWKLSREDSVIRALPEPPSEIIVIDHQAPKLRCSLGNGGKDPQTVLG